MKDQILVALSIVFFCGALFIGNYSQGSVGLEDAHLEILPITFCGFTISFAISAYSKKDKIMVFYDSLKYSFGTSSLILILGYFTFCLYPLIF